MTRMSCRNYLLCLESEDLLVTFAKSSLFEISSNAKMILSSLSRHLPPKYQISFRLTSEEVADIVRSLDILTERGILEGEMYYSALEILQSCTHFIQYEPNREALAYSSIYKPIAHLLQNGNTAEKKAACELLWKLVTKAVSEETVTVATKLKKTAMDSSAFDPQHLLSQPNIQSFLIHNYPELLAILSTLTEGYRGEDSSLKILFSTVLTILKEESTYIIEAGWLLFCLFVLACLLACLHLTI